MAKFYGMIGFGQTSETVDGVWTDTPIERPYYGDVQTLTKRASSDADTVNDNITLTNAISIISDPFAINHFFEIRYVRWLEAVWKVNNVEVKQPRLILHLGEVYNGPTA
ncbi:MAG: hypothetical protein LBD57_04245 [Endomicrobium sp.]|jgi:hypothetical protein|uniref:DUF7253 family protein n=1 Tax=Candidatus Endomicrobiellum cubanum TaxID=3242325 RepID=UPI002827D26A|nr:hypothetical protein [Endomicrobium sp.]